MVRGVIRNLTVVTVAPNRTRAMIVTPAREMVIISATIANGIAQAQRNLSFRGKSDVRAATITGVGGAQQDRQAVGLDHRAGHAVKAFHIPLVERQAILHNRPPSPGRE